MPYFPNCYLPLFECQDWFDSLLYCTLCRIPALGYDYKFCSALFSLHHGKPKFSDQFKKIINRYKKKLDVIWISCLGVAMGFSLIARRWVRPQTKRWFSFVG